MANKMPAIVLEGDQELMDLLDSIPSRMMTAAKQAMKKAVKPVIADAKRRLTPGHGFRTGQLQKSIGMRPKEPQIDRQKQRVWVYVGPRAGFKARIRVPQIVRDSFGRPTGITYAFRNHDPVAIAHLVEFGHRIAVEDHGKASRADYVLRPSKPWHEKAKNAGFVPARPFLRPAIDSNRSAFLERMKEALRRTLEKKAKPARRRAA